MKKQNYSKIKLKALTERQCFCLGVVINHIKDKGFPPTHLEVAAMMGINSSKGASDHLKAIEKKGYIKIHYGIPRGIQLINKKIGV